MRPCAQCGVDIIAPAWSEYVSARCVRNLWCCDTCGYDFEDTVLFLALELEADLTESEKLLDVAAGLASRLTEEARHTTILFRDAWIRQRSGGSRGTNLAQSKAAFAHADEAIRRQGRRGKLSTAILTGKDEQQVPFVLPFLPGYA